MAEIPLRDQILEAINVTRQRKARPDRERIRNYMLRHFSVARSDTDAALEQLVSSGDVIVEVYKGYISYRNAILCSRRVLHKDIIYPKSNEDVEAHTSVIQGFYELSLQQPDYLDTGVPEDVLRKYLSITGRVVPEGGLIRALSKEIKSGFLAQLSNGNYVLRFNKEPLNTSVDRRKWLQNTCQDSSAYKSARNRSLSSNPPNISNLNISKVVSSRESFNEKDGQNSIGNWNVGSSKQSYRDATLSRNGEQRENAAGLRLGTRKKKAKKVFDPSFMHPPTRKRGRPPLKKNTCMKHTMINKPLCSICNRQKSGDIVLCANCKKIAHYTCAFAKCDVDSVQNPWTCSECRICTFCLEPSENELMEICFKCDNAYHYSCHVPPITEKKLTGNWICSFCDESNPQFNVKVVNGPECRQSVCRNFVDVQQQNIEIIREIKLENSKTLSYPLFPKTAMCKIFIDDNTPDASNWSSEEVYKYLVTRGCAEQASVFQENEIDGYSLLMLTRNDVLYNLNLKLGPALKVYLEVQILQAKVAGRCSVYYE